AVRTDITGILYNILRLRPKTTTLAVVMGSSPIEKFWVNAVREAAAPLMDRVNLVYLNELPFDEILKRIATLPPNSAILLGPLWVDAQGIPRLQEAALTGMHSVANAPIFGVYEYQLGRGIVGGPLLPMRRLGLQTTEIATRILGGEVPGDIKPVVMQMN